MFRRRRASTEGPPADGLPDAVPGEEVPAAAEPATAGPAPAGPWDAGDDVPDQDRIDFGSLRVPLGDEFEVQVSVADSQPAWITVVSGDSGLQLQAFAAAKSGGLWDEVRAEIAAEVAAAVATAVRPKGRSAPNCGRGSSPPSRSRAGPVASGSRSGSWAWTGRAGSCAA